MYHISQALLASQIVNQKIIFWPLWPLFYCGLMHMAYHFPSLSFWSAKNRVKYLHTHVQQIFRTCSYLRIKTVYLKHQFPFPLASTTVLYVSVSWTLLDTSILRSYMSFSIRIISVSFMTHPTLICVRILPSLSLVNILFYVIFCLIIHSLMGNKIALLFLRLWTLLL